MTTIYTILPEEENLKKELLQQIEDNSYITWYYLEIKENKRTTCTWIDMTDIPLSAKRFYSRRMQIVMLKDTSEEYIKITKWIEKEIKRVKHDT